MMKCPKCNDSMETVTVDGIEIDRCTGCEGLWFDLREHEHLKTRPGSEKIDIGDPEFGAETNSIRDITCPRCKAKMTPLSFHDQTHIQYEQCSVCGGVFLDAGEFTDFKHLTWIERAKRALRWLRS